MEVRNTRRRTYTKEPTAHETLRHLVVIRIFLRRLQELLWLPSVILLQLLRVILQLHRVNRGVGMCCEDE